MAAIPMITNIKNANTVIRDGDIVFLSANNMGITQTKAPVILSQGCIVPSGTYGSTTHGTLGDRFRHPGTSVTEV